MTTFPAHTYRGTLALLGLLVLASSAGAQMSFPPGPPAADPPGPLVPPDPPPGARAALCALRDQALGNSHQLFQKLQLTDLFKNYYCDGGCFMCCKIPGASACHSSFDYNEYGLPPVNCSPEVYGAGTDIVGEALIIGDPLGTGFCAGGVQQVCNHLPVCSGDGAASAPAAAAGPAFAAPSPLPSFSSLRSSGAMLSSASGSPAPHPDMSLPGAIGSRAKAFAKAILHNYTQNIRNRAPGLSFRDYVDFATARGARRHALAMTDVEPYSESYDVFRVEDADGTLLPDESYQLGILYHANLALLGGVPNLLDRLGYVESRYWTEAEKDAYLGGVEPEAELRKTMGPIALAALKQVPIQDWRLLAVPSPSEPLPTLRSFEGFELGQAPVVNAAIDCSNPGETALSIQLDDPEQSVSPGFLYPVIVNWGDGTFSRHVYDDSQTPAVVTHRYATPGTYQAYVSVSNVTGLRGVAGIVIDEATGAGVGEPLAISRLELDAVDGYGPALITAGDLSFEIAVRRPDGSDVIAGWTNSVRLASAGATPIAGMLAHNDARTPIDAVVLRPEITGAYFYDSSYIQSESITLSFYDPELGEETTRTVPLTADLIEVYYEGASDPVPPELLERDLNGELIIPVERPIAALPANHCGGLACTLVDRIEIPITPALLAERPSSNAAATTGLSSGNVARWLEDVPGTFIAHTDLSAAVVPGSCGGMLNVDLVTPADPVSSLVSGLTLVGANPTVSAGASDYVQAIATLNDGSVIDVTDRVTWRSSDPVRLTVSNGQDKGRVEAGIVPGHATITASLGEHEVSTTGTNASPSQGYRHYRMRITEIHGAIGRGGLNAVELIVGGTILENKMVSDVEGSIGPFPATVATAPGSGALFAFDASFGTGWTSPDGTFNTTAPYAVGAEPVYLELRFDEPTPVEGMRLHPQGGINPVSFAPQFPKEVVIEGSQDGSAFETLTTHRIENWDYEPVEIPIPLPEASTVLQLLAGACLLLCMRRR